MKGNNLVQAVAHSIINIMNQLEENFPEMEDKL